MCDPYPSLTCPDCGYDNDPDDRDDDVINDTHWEAMKEDTR